MGLSSSKTKSTSTSTPYTVAQPFIDSTLKASNDVFTQNQPILQQQAQTAQQAFNDLAPGIFKPSAFVSGAQGAATDIFSGKYLGGNPGAQTYSSVMAGQSNPASGALTSLAAGSTSPGDYGGIGATNPALAAYQSIINGGGSTVANPAAGYDQSVLGGKYLNAQPSAGLYGDLINGDPAVNPYVDQIAQQGIDAATKATNQRFGQSGLGAGLSTAYTDVLGKSVTNANNQIRYTAYNDAANRQLTAAGQSDAAFANERNNMEGASGRVSSNFNAAQDRNLQAASGLGSTFTSQQGLQLQGQQARDAAFQNDRSAQLAGATTLGSQYLQGQQNQLTAAGASDSAYNAQMQQMLSALGLTGGLSDAQYSGVNPGLNLLTAASQIPYTGINAQAGALNSLAGRYGTQTGTSTTSGNIGASLMGIGGSVLGGWATGGFK